ncbi:MAG: hypothetical protein LWY06_01275, partial [Firmicutes bacterium]|nr:hypothetical protein [Bacillota bacterium]
YSLWLSVFDIRDNITTRLIRLSEAKWPEKAWNDSIWSRQFTKWSPSPKHPYIATTPQGKIVIVDANKKSIIKTIDMGVPKSLRWSGDGRYLGFLILDVIYIYDVEKDKITNIYRDFRCFDFLWVD